MRVRVMIRLMVRLELCGWRCGGCYWRCDCWMIVRVHSSNRYYLRISVMIPRIPRVQLLQWFQWLKWFQALRGLQVFQKFQYLTILVMHARLIFSFCVRLVSDHFITMIRVFRLYFEMDQFECRFLTPNLGKCLALFRSRMDKHVGSPVYFSTELLTH